MSSNPGRVKMGSNSRSPRASRSMLTLQVQPYSSTPRGSSHVQRPFRLPKWSWKRPVWHSVADSVGPVKIPGSFSCASSMASHQPSAGAASLSVRQATTPRPLAQCRSSLKPTDRAPAGPVLRSMRTHARLAASGHAANAGERSAGDPSSTRTTASGLRVCLASAASVCRSSSTSCSVRENTGSTTVSALGCAPKPPLPASRLAVSGNRPAWDSKVPVTTETESFLRFSSGWRPLRRAKAARPR
mmetsp:Transcript_12125/g.34347  ORF Transcript_12125/g.34347 Transcript_12125/m.34347 type:complete len:244 (-) Transcript_12125:203-934(-)